MDTKEMQDTFHKFREKYPLHRGLDLRTQKEILDGVKVIVKMSNNKFAVMTKEEVAPGGKLDKINAATRKVNALNRAMKKKYQADLMDMISREQPLLFDVMKHLDKLNRILK